MKVNCKYMSVEELDKEAVLFGTAEASPQCPVNRLYFELKSIFQELKHRNDIPLGRMYWMDVNGTRSDSTLEISCNEDADGDHSTLQIKPQKGGGFSWIEYKWKRDRVNLSTWGEIKDQANLDLNDPKHTIRVDDWLKRSRLLDKESDYPNMSDDEEVSVLRKVFGAKGRGKLSKVLALLGCVEKEVRDITTQVNSTDNTYEVRISNHFYSHYRRMAKYGITQSCMSHECEFYSIELNGEEESPLVLYENDPDWGLALLSAKSTRNKDGYNFVARAVVHLPTKTIVSVYGQDSIAAALFEEAGLERSHSFMGGGARGIKVMMDDDGSIIFPYIDGSDSNGHLVDQETYLEFTGCGGITADYETGCGYDEGARWYCSYCDHDHHEDEVDRIQVEDCEDMCQDAVNCNYVVECADGEYRLADCCVYIGSRGDWYSTLDSDIKTCFIGSELGHIDDMTHIESLDEWVLDEHVVEVDGVAYSSCQEGDMWMIGEDGCTPVLYADDEIEETV